MCVSKTQADCGCWSLNYNFYCTEKKVEHQSVLTTDHKKMPDRPDTSAHAAAARTDGWITGRGWMQLLALMLATADTGRCVEISERRVHGDDCDISEDQLVTPSHVRQS